MTKTLQQRYTLFRQRCQRLNDKRLGELIAMREETAERLPSNDYDIGCLEIAKAVMATRVIDNMPLGF